jgi:hypothetical protein
VSLQSGYLCVAMCDNSLLQPDVLVLAVRLLVRCGVGCGSVLERDGE